MTVQNLYTQYLDGKVTKAKFLYEVRRDQNLDMISHHNNFDDTIKILKNKSIISEKASKESTGKQDVEVIAKTIDMVNPYEYSRGIDYELNTMDIPAPGGDLSNDNVLKAQKKVLANLTKNPQFYFDKIYSGDNKEVSDKWIETTKKNIDAIGKGKAVKGLMRESIDINIKDGSKIQNVNNNETYTVARKRNNTVYARNSKGKVVTIGSEAFNAYKIISESFNSGLVKEDQQNAIFEKYARATGIPLENLKSMVRDAKEKKNKVDEEAQQYNTSETESIYENEAFEEDNEPHQLHIELAQLAKNAIGLAQALKVLEAEGVDNLPQWFQEKIIIAHSYIKGAKEYLEGEMGNGIDEGETAKTNDQAHNSEVLKQISQVPNSGAKAELTKAFNSGQAINI